MYRGGRVGKRNRKKLVDGLRKTGEMATQQTEGRRKLAKDELKSYIASLSSGDSELKVEALKQLSGMAFHAEIETDKNLLPRLALLVDDENLSVKRAALFLFERLSWRILPSHRTGYNRRLLPKIAKVALSDEDVEVKKNALEGIVASKADIAVDIFVKLLTTLPEDQYKQVILDNTWSTMVDIELGPKLQQSLFKAYEKSDAAIRNRISRETTNRYFGRSRLQQPQH